MYFCFFQLPIQELLAAIHISQMPSKQQISVFQELFGTPRFNAVSQFYAGITKLRTSRPWLSKLPRVLCPVPASVYDLVRIAIRKELNNFGKSKSLLVSILLCLHEAEDESLCVFVASLLNRYLSLANTILTPFDCLSVGYMLSIVSTRISGLFHVNLKDCSIGDQGCKFMVRGICKYLSTRSNITSQLKINLQNNNIHKEGIHHISHLLKETTMVYNLDLSWNSIGESGLKNLCETLSTNTTLKVLKLYKCELSLTEDNGHLLYHLLHTNTSLSCLSLSGNQLFDCHHIAAGLSNNKTLRVLWLICCGLTDSSIETLSLGLNNYIEEVHIGSNDSITENGLRILAKHLFTLSGLRCLRIPCHLESSITTVFSDSNAERRKNGLLEIEVTGECGVMTANYDCI